LRGMYDNRCRLKQANRRAEQLLLAAEKLSFLCHCLGLGYPTESLPDLWRKVLYNQLHDIIGGSHIGDNAGIVDVVASTFGPSGQALRSAALDAES